jgi:hypothetical protein
MEINSDSRQFLRVANIVCVQRGTFPYSIPQFGYAYFARGGLAEALGSTAVGEGIENCQRERSIL